MKRVGAVVLSIYFILSGILPNSDLCCELPKLRNLIDHYDNHNTLGVIDVFDFFISHYGFYNSTDHSHNDQDHDEHDKLPFKDIDKCCPGIVFIPTFNCYIQTLEPTQQDKPIVVYSTHSGTEYIDSILHPPKV